jgi:hypothetical protein
LSQADYLAQPGKIAIRRELHKMQLGKLQFAQYDMKLMCALKAPMAVLDFYLNNQINILNGNSEKFSAASYSDVTCIHLRRVICSFTQRYPTAFNMPKCEINHILTIAGFSNR